MILTRRNFLVAGTVAPLLVTAGCSATGLLQKIDAITKAADAVLSTLDQALCPTAGSCVTLPYIPLVTAWIASIEGANAQALSIANGAATLSATQLTQIIGVYAGAVVFNIPGVPAAVTVVINAVVAAVDVLLSFIGAPATAIAAFHRGDVSAVPAIAHQVSSLASVPTNRGLFFKEHVRNSMKLNDALGTHVAAINGKLSHATMAGLTPQVAAGGFGQGGFGR